MGTITKTKPGGGWTTSSEGASFGIRISRGLSGGPGLLFTSGLDLSTISSALKDIYIPAVRDLAFEESPLLKYIKVKE